jgi:hypothetical protein
MALLQGKNLRRTARLLAVAGAALVPVIATAVPADAAVRTTRYYTIDVRPPYEGAVPLFLGATAGDNVRTARYASGEHKIQWTPTYPEWPNSPTVTGGAGSGCSYNGCDFSGHGPGPVKLVNRATRTCLTMVNVAGRGPRAVVARCGTSRAPVAGQIFQIIDNDAYSWIALERRAAGCLDFAFIQYGVGTAFGSSACKDVWSQDYRRLGVDQVTCKPAAINDLCGLDPVKPSDKTK